MSCKPSRSLAPRPLRCWSPTPTYVAAVSPTSLVRRTPRAGEFRREVIIVGGQVGAVTVQRLRGARTWRHHDRMRRALRMLSTLLRHLSGPSARASNVAPHG